MHALSGWPATNRLVLGALMLGFVPNLPACKPRVTSTQCDQLIARYAALVVKEKVPDASPATIEVEQKREREQAAHEDSFRNCTTEVQPDEFACAMAAKTADAFEKCLE